MSFNDLTPELQAAHQRTLQEYEHETADDSLQRRTLQESLIDLRALNEQVDFADAEVFNGLVRIAKLEVQIRTLKAQLD